MDIELVGNEGTLDEPGIGTAEILWSYNPIGGKDGHGTFTFTTLQRLSGDICQGCGYSGNFDEKARTKVSGVWNWPNGQIGGIFVLGS